MRSRYYNVTIKRFINADTERGNITNGKSLNRYSYVQGNPVSYTDPYGLSPLDNPSAMAHILFGLLGVVPGLVGATADLANAILYFTEGKYTEGVISLIGGIASVFGIPCVDKMIKAGKLGKYAADIARITKLMSNTAGFLINGENTIRQSMDMCHKYFVDKKGVSAETAAELALLAASVLGTYLSAKGIKDSVAEWRIKGKVGKSGDVITDGGSVKSSTGFDKWLNKGESDNKVYFGIDKNGRAVYTGITKQSKSDRLYQHNRNGKEFTDLEVQYDGLTRNQARAIEQYYIENGPNEKNKINSISSKNKYYKQAMEWAEKYIKEH